MLAALALLALTGWAMTGCGIAPNRTPTTGNIAAAEVTAAPTGSAGAAALRWYTGQLTVEPAGAGRACLLLVTPHGSFVLRATNKQLTPVAWEDGGQFDATHSGIARGDRLIAPYSQARTSVRGAQVAESDRVCTSHPVLALTAVAKGARPRSRPTPSPTRASTASAEQTSGDGPELTGALPDPVWYSGTLILVHGNQDDDPCVALNTAAGAYSLGSSTNDYDVVLDLYDGKVDRRRTGIHIHGRNALGMARLLGQKVEVRGQVEPGTGFECSRYHQLTMDALR